MNYPLISEYVKAIKLAEDNLDKLSYLRPVLDVAGNPIMSSGNFAVVFKMKDERNGELHALKCFIKEQEGRGEAYKLIADELEYVSSSFIIPITYLEKELFVDTNNSDEIEFPVLLMDWIEGVTLDKYVRSHLSDQYSLQITAYQFCRLATWLMAQPFAHGDLKPDNILVKDDGSLVIVDYDGMYVPAMKGQRAREIGSPDYRHPLRTADDFNEHIDDFSLATIAMQLYAISLQPDLLTAAQGDTLLLTETDYRDLSKCRMMSSLLSMVSDAEFAKLLGLFFIAFSENSLSKVLFRAFNISKPTKPVVIPLSTEVTDEDWANAVKDDRGGCYSPDRVRLLCGPYRGLEFNIDPRTKIICDNCFFDIYSEIEYSYLQKIHIPSSVVKIGKNPFCRSIEDIVCDSPYYVVEGKYLLSADRKKIVFYFGKENDIRLPESVTHIGSGAFCSMSISSISIPSSIVQIDANPFVDNFNGLEHKSPMELICDSQIFEVNNYSLFHKLEHRIIAYWGENAIYTVPEGIKEIGENAFLGANIEILYLPDSLEFIHETAFYFCLGIKQIFVSKGSKERMLRLITRRLDKNLVIEYDRDELPFPFY